MKKSLCLLCICALSLSLFSGCGSPESAASSAPASVSESISVPVANVPEASAEGPTPDQPMESTVEEPVVEDPSEPVEYAVVEFPFSEEETHLTYMLPSPNVPEGYGITSYSDFAVIQTLNDKSNVNMEFIEVSFFTYGEQFNLVCASNDLPDIMYGVSSYFAAGLTAAEEQGIIIPLNDYLEECAPDYLRLLEERGMEKNVKNDDGHILQFSQTMDSLAQKSGGVVRSDWLEEQGLEVPQTIAQLEEVLYAFKSKYDCAQPMYMTSTQPGVNLIYAYGIPADGTEDCMFQRDGIVEAVYNTTALKDYITLLNKWCADGLFTRDYMTIAYDPFAQAEKVLLAENDVGVWNANLNDLTAYGDVAEEGFSLEPVPSIVLNEDDTLHCSSLSYQEAAEVSITTGSENPEIAVKWINYWFTEEGSAAYNYGIEGKTFEMVDGKVEFTDFVNNNPDGLTSNQALRLYCLAGQMPGYQHQKRTAVYYDDIQNKAWDIWTDSLGDNANIIPSGVSMTAEESAEYASIMNDIFTYASENIPRFVMGERPMDEWDDFVEEVNSMNLERGIEIYQGALERYNAR